MIVWLLDKQNTLIFPEVVEFFKDNQRWTKACFTSEDHIQNLARIDNFWGKLQSPTLEIDLDIENILNQKADKEYAYNPYNDKEMQYQNELKAWNLKVSEIKQKIRIEYIEKWRGLREEYSLGQTQKLEKDVSMSSEVPIMGYNKFIIGYWDMVIDLRVPHYKTNNFLFWCGKQEDGDTIYRRIRLRGIDENDPVSIIKSIFIEVKPVIRSFGETLRQLKTYQSFVPDAVGRTYLFTVDMKFKAAFETQGIKVVEYQPDTSFNRV